MKRCAGTGAGEVHLASDGVWRPESAPAAQALSRTRAPVSVLMILAAIASHVQDRDSLAVPTHHCCRHVGAVGCGAVGGGPVAQRAAGAELPSCA